MAEPSARIQISKAELEQFIRLKLDRNIQHNNGLVYNTWYGKFSGGDPHRNIERSAFRCNPHEDAGKTRSNGPFFCLWFARGVCYRGEDCLYLHRIPSNDDQRMLDSSTDCFGRKKFTELRDDMGGVGSFIHPNRTLFVGFFSENVSTGVIKSCFENWGPVESVKTGKNNKSAFVTYKYEANAEFANEAMSYQTITGKETLILKWSREHIDQPIAAEIDMVIRQIVKSIVTKKKKK